MAEAEKNKELERIPFNTDIDVEQRYAEHWHLWQKYKETKEQTIRFFSKNGVSRNILDYVKDSVDRMNEYHEKPGYKEDWQNNVFDPITRDKLIAVLSQLASARMKAEVLCKPTSIFYKNDSQIRQRVYSDLLENANIKNDDEYQLIWEMFTAMSEGTVIGYEGWKKDVREVEYVKEYNPDTGEKTTEKIKIEAWDDVFGEIVPIEEWYPETIWTANKKNIKRCFRVREMTYASFHDAYIKFKNATFVKTAGYYREHNLPWGVSEDIYQENVQVIEFYDEVKDKLGIWANGTEIYYGCLPFNHKSLPFWIAIFEPIHHQLIFGKSLPDKLMGMQDINNALFNAMLDQLLISLKSPIFIDGMSELEEDYLEPLRIIRLDPGTQVQKGNLGNIDQTAFSMLQLIKRSMEESSVSAQAQGVPTGGRKTKFEVQQLQEAALNLASLFLQLMERSMKDKYRLRLYNILQYYTMPSQVESGKEKYKFIVLDDRKLTNGKVGRKMIQIVGSNGELESREKLQERVKYDSMAVQDNEGNFDVLKSRIEPIQITRDFLMNREVELEIRIIPNSSIKESEVQKKNKDLAFYQATAENPMFDQEQNAKDFARAFDKPESIVKKQEQVPAAGQVSGLPGMPGTEGQPAPQNMQPNMELL